VFKKGYKYNGKCAWRNNERVSEWDATHCNSAKALHTRLEECAFKDGGVNNG
jgi:hypothetical protein